MFTYPLLLIAISSYALAQTVYTWTDEYGVLHFSDIADSQKAKMIEIPKYPQSQLPTIKGINSSSQLTDNNEQDSKAVLTLTITITYPEHDQALRSNNGEIVIHTQLNRKLTSNETLQLVMDGSNYHSPKTDVLWQLSNIDRGTHTFMIQAYSSGKLIASSNTIKVHLLRSRQQKASLPIETR